MITVTDTHFMPCEPISLVELLTASFFHLNDGIATPHSLGIPHPAGTSGLTLLYYTRALTPIGNAYHVLVDAQVGVNAAMDGTSVGGTFAGGLTVNGAAYGQGPFTIYNTPDWKVVALRTQPGAEVYPAGQIILNNYAGAAGRQYAPLAVDYAYLLVYHRVLSAAELAAPVPPRDYAQRYEATGYVPGDATVAEMSGSGLDATLYY